MPAGAASQCPCDGCRNYARSRKNFSQPLLDVLEGLGVDPAKEVFVKRVAPLDEAKSLYSVAYGVCGTLAGKQAGDGPVADVFEPLGEEIYAALRVWKAPPAPWPEGESARLELLIPMDWIMKSDPHAPLDLAECVATEANDG